MDAVGIVVTAIWAMVPAYIPNNVAVVAGGGRPIDGGRTVAGRRVLGDGKTWRGAFTGFVAGVVVALGFDRIEAALDTVVGVDVPGFPVAVVIGLPAGAMLGDILASGVKRRVGEARGARVPVLDQLDFVVGALCLTWVTAPMWAGMVFTAWVVVAVLVVTPLLHVGTNAVAYAVGLKDVPW